MFKQLFRAASGKIFPKNPNGENLPENELSALSVGAILAAARTEYCNSLETGTAANSKRGLSEWWGVSQQEDAIETLESLKNKRQSQAHKVALACVAYIPKRKGVSLAPPLEDYIEALSKAQMPLIDSDIKEEYPHESELAEMHFDTLHKYSGKKIRDDDMQVLTELFGNEETIALCFDIFNTVMDNYENFIDNVVNLRNTLKTLQRGGFVSAEADFANIDTSAWDLGRLVNVARWAYEVNFISKEQAWEYILSAYKESATLYADWDSFGKAYVVGRAVWGGDGMELDNTIATYNSLLKDEESPWKITRLN